MVFTDRQDAGRQLADALKHFKARPVVVFGVARGGVVVAAEVAAYLGTPLDVIIARKIGHPLSPELALGAVTEMGEPAWDTSQLGATTSKWRDQQVTRARQEARRARLKYQDDCSSLDVDIRGKTAIVIDDGIATGMTMIAALRAIRDRYPAYIVMAVPVAPRNLPNDILRYTQARMHVLYTPEGEFGAVGNYYKHFDQVTDEEVRQLLYSHRPIPQVLPLDLPALQAVVGTVTRYPVSNGELIDRARRLHAPENVITFLESIPPDIDYEARTDIMLRADETNLNREEELSHPDVILEDENTS